MIVSSFCLNDWDEEIMTSFLQLWNLRKNARACTQQTAKTQRIQLPRKWVIGCIRGFLKHKKFLLRQEIEPSPSVRHIHCLNSSLFSLQCWQAGTPNVFGRKKNLRFFTVSLRYHFKDCRGVLICKDTGVKGRERKNTAHPQLIHLPHLYQKSELLEVKCGGNV